MPDDVIMSLTADVARLKREIEILKSSRAQFPVWSYSLLTPSTSQNNYDVGNAGIIFITPGANINITGIAGGVAGRIIIIRGAGANTITFKQLSGSSLAANRLANVNGVDVVLGGSGDTVCYVYTGSTWTEFFKDT